MKATDVLNRLRQAREMNKSDPVKASEMIKEVEKQWRAVKA
jgi:hypothetical protein